MSDSEKLEILKHDLQMATDANDDYLLKLLGLSESAIRREGIELTKDDLESDMAVIQYAAFLFRKRAASDTTMPRSLRWQLNNMLFGRKGKQNDV